jgi:hypothetical protein
MKSPMEVRLKAWEGVLQLNAALHVKDLEEAIGKLTLWPDGLPRHFTPSMWALSRSTFEEIMGERAMCPAVQHLFDLLIEGRRGGLSGVVAISRGEEPECKADAFEAFTAMALCARGDMSEKVAFLHELYDVDSKGYIVRDELGALIEAAGRALWRVGLGTPLDPIDVDFLSGRANYEGGRLTLEQFHSWAVAEPAAVELWSELSLPHKLAKVLTSLEDGILVLKKRYETDKLSWYDWQDRHRLLLRSAGESSHALVTDPLIGLVGPWGVGIGYCTACGDEGGCGVLTVEVLRQGCWEVVECALQTVGKGLTRGEIGCLPLKELPQGAYVGEKGLRTSITWSQSQYYHRASVALSNRLCSDDSITVAILGGHDAAYSLDGFQQVDVVLHGGLRLRSSDVTRCKLWASRSLQSAASVCPSAAHGFPFLPKALWDVPMQDDPALSSWHWLIGRNCAVVACTLRGCEEDDEGNSAGRVYPDVALRCLETMSSVILLLGRNPLIPCSGEPADRISLKAVKDWAERGRSVLIVVTGSGKEHDGISCRCRTEEFEENCLVQLRLGGCTAVEGKEGPASPSGGALHSSSDEAVAVLASVSASGAMRASLRSPPHTPARVRVLVGPIVGIVTLTSATVLVTVDSFAQITVVLDDIDGDSPSPSHEETMFLSPRTPCIFSFEGLRPLVRWSISMRGPTLESHDALSRVGRMRTASPLSWWAFAPTHQHDLGDRCSLLCDLQSPRPMGAATVHCSSQVIGSIEHRLEDHCAATAYERARAWAQGVFECEWGASEFRRKVLSAGPNIVLPSGGSMARALLAAWRGASLENVQGTSARAAVQAILDVSNEYESSLWGPQPSGFAGSGRRSDSGGPLLSNFGRGLFFASLGWEIQGLDPVLTGHRSKSLLDNCAWLWLTQLLAQPSLMNAEDMHTLVLVSSQPFVGCDGGDWMEHSDDLVALLGMLFNWMNAPGVATVRDPAVQTDTSPVDGWPSRPRKFVLLCGCPGLSAPAVTYIRDEATGLAARQWCVPAPPAFNATPFLVKGGTTGSIGPRFAFFNECIPSGGSICLVHGNGVYLPAVDTIGCGSTVWGTLGPVLGAISSTSARLVIELSSPAVITCIADPVATEMFPSSENTNPVVQTVRVSFAHSPTVVELSGLKPECRYCVRFSPLVNAVKYVATFRTSAARPSYMSIVAIWRGGTRLAVEDVHQPSGLTRTETCRADPQLMRSARSCGFLGGSWPEASSTAQTIGPEGIWQTIAGACSRPSSALNLVVHLGEVAPLSEALSCDACQRNYSGTDASPDSPQRISPPPYADPPMLPYEPLELQKTDQAALEIAVTQLQGLVDICEGLDDDSTGQLPELCAAYLSDIDRSISLPGLERVERGGLRLADGVAEDGAEILQKGRDAYRICWGLPFHRAVLSSTQQAVHGFTPADLGKLAHQFRNPKARPQLCERLRKEYQESLDAAQTKSLGRHDRTSLTFHGGVGILSIDPWASLKEQQRVRAADDISSPRGLLSSKQKQMIQGALTDPALCALVVCCGVPFVAAPVVHPPLSPTSDASRRRSIKRRLRLLKDERNGREAEQEYRALREELQRSQLISYLPISQAPVPGPFLSEDRPLVHWSWHSIEMKELLERIFDWMLEADPSGRRGSRSAVLLCGGTLGAVKTVVRDRQTGLSLVQLCPGPAGCSSEIECPWPSSGPIGQRLEYRHEISPSPCYAKVEVLAEPTFSCAYADLCQHPSATVPQGGMLAAVSAERRATIGPVFGRLQSFPRDGTSRSNCRVPVLLEVDVGGELACIAHDALTSERFEVRRCFSANRPRVFWLQGLRHARRYLVEFEGICNSKEHMGQLTTPDLDQPDLSLAVVSGDRPGELLPTQQPLWNSLGDKLGEPWHGIEMIVHIGRQLHSQAAFSEGAEYLKRVAEDEGVAEAEEEVREIFRSDYRRLWGQPSTRRALASTSNLMMQWYAPIAVNESNITFTKETFIRRRVVHLAREVYREYQRQLWDPKWGAQFEGSEGDHEGFIVHFKLGTAAIMFMDLFPEVPSADAMAAQLSMLRTALSSDKLIVMVVVLPVSLLDDDVKSLMPELQWTLFSLLSEWKGALSGRETHIISGGDTGHSAWFNCVPSVDKAVGEDGTAPAPNNQSDSVVRIQQSLVGPVTAEPRVVGDTAAVKGSISPADESESRLQHVEFSSLVVAESRNYAIVEIIADVDDEGPIGLVMVRHVMPETADEMHPVEEFTYPPPWWPKYCLGDPIVLLADVVYLKVISMRVIICCDWPACSISSAGP